MTERKRDPWHPYVTAPLDITPQEVLATAELDWALSEGLARTDLDKEIMVSQRELKDVMAACYDRIIRLEKRIKELEANGSS